MDPIPFEDRLRWDEFARQSPDAWFWHTSHWMDYTAEYARDRFVENRSFAIADDGAWLAICPLVILQHREREGIPAFRQFAFFEGTVPFPAIRGDLSRHRRDEAVRCYVQALREIAAKDGVGHVRVRVPALAASYLGAGGPKAHPLLRHGFIDLPYLTQVIDLTAELNLLWGNIRKGARADIRRAQRLCAVRIWDRDTITPERFAAYQALHHKDAGRVTRSQRTFDLMLSWIRSGCAFLAEVHRDERTIAFVLAVVYGRGAYYGSTCRDPDDQTPGASHLLQWEVMQWLRRNGYAWYDMGLQWFGPVWFENVTPKDVAISSFKRGFGGTTVPLLTAEFYYESALGHRLIARQWDRYWAEQTRPASNDD